MDLINTDVTSPQISYTYTNYMIFIHRFEQLVSEIMDHTSARTISVKSKWNMILIPFTIIPFILTIFSFYFYKKHIKRYENVMDLYKYIKLTNINK